MDGAWVTMNATEAPTKIHFKIITKKIIWFASVSQTNNTQMLFQQKYVKLEMDCIVK